jgi:hypothetical protein
MEYQLTINNRLLVVKEHDGVSFKVYHDTDLLGIITPEIDPDLGLIWTTEDEALKDICEQVGEAIERADM